MWIANASRINHWSARTPSPWVTKHLRPQKRTDGQNKPIASPPSRIAFDPFPNLFCLSFVPLPSLGNSRLEAIKLDAPNTKPLSNYANLT